MTDFISTEKIICHNIVVITFIDYRVKINVLSPFNPKILPTINSYSGDYNYSTTNNINFLLLCDYNKTVIKQFDIEFSDFFNLEGYTVAKRSVFIVDKAGIIQYKWIADDPGQEPDYAEIDSKISSMN